MVNSTLKHPKLLSYFGYFVVKEKCYLKLLMECAEGTLHDLMYKQKQLLKYEQILRIALDVALGLQALHQQRILHRHLKASHVMVCIFFQKYNCADYEGWFRQIAN